MNRYVSPLVPPRKTSRRRADQLPGGRHGLSRSFVMSNQRERLMSAVAEATTVNGYVAMTIEDICRAAGVSRRTFYEHFRNKEDVFLAAYDTVAAQILTHVSVAYTTGDTATERVRSALRAFLDFLASEPAFADMCIVEVLAAGPRALERRASAMRGFSQLFVRAAEEELGDTCRRPPALVAETIVGGVYEVVYARIQQGRTEELPELLPELLYSILVAYAGPDVAQAELEREQA